MSAAPGEQTTKRGARPFALRLRGGALAGFGESAGFAILAYVLVLAALRLTFSPFLEVDEAEFVGRVDFRLVYDNSHPPLFNWLTRIALEFTDWNWALSVTIVKYGALALFHWCVWRLTRKLAGPRTAALAVAVSAFLPQIVWMSATTLAHSTLVMAAAAATLFTAHRALRKPSGGAQWRAFALFGAAAAAGALSKFNFGLFLAPFLAALLIDPALRARLLRPAALAALGVFVLLVAPTAIESVVNLEDSARRIGKLYREGGALAAIDIEGVGIDGFIGLVVALLAWAAPAAAIWALALWHDRGKPAEIAPVDAFAAAYVRAIGRTMAGGLALFALGVLAADVHSVHERYLTPILVGLPVWLAAALPLRRSARWTALAAAAAYLAALVGFWAQVSFSPHRFAIPYQELGAFIARETPAPVPIIATRHDDEANALLALGWPGAASPEALRIDSPERPEEAILLWRGRGTAPDRLVPDGFGPMAGVVTVALRYRNGIGKELVYSFQRFEQLDRPPRPPAAPNGSD